MSTYLVALIAGPYAALATTSTPTSTATSRWASSAAPRWPSTWTPSGCSPRPSRVSTSTTSNFGVPYPFGKYDQLFVPEFNAGAMENAGAVTFLEEYVFRSRVTRYFYERRAETVLHEMAHMWFGDLVTMRWWDDLWLNESFATLASVLCQAEATEYTKAWTTFANVEKSWAYGQDQLPSTHPIAADMADLPAVEVNFDGITYAKGASVLKQLVAYVGFEEFLAGLRDYFRDHAFGNATFEDLLGALEKTSGRDLSRLGQAVAQDHRPEHPARRLRRRRRRDVHPVRGGAVRRRAGRRARPGRTGWPSASTTTTPGKLVRVHRVELDVDGARTEVPELVGVSRGALVLVNDDDLTYCKVRLDPGVAADRARPHRRHRRAAAPHAGLVGGLGDDPGRRDAGPRLRRRWCIGGIARRDQVGVAQRLLLQAQTALGSYAEPGWADETGWPAFGDAAAGAGPRVGARARITSWRS